MNLVEVAMEIVYLLLGLAVFGLLFGFTIMCEQL
jgi:hypothetical protein